MTQKPEALDQIWQMVKDAENRFKAIDGIWKELPHGPYDSSTLVYEYKLQEIVKEAHNTLVRKAISEILAKHDVHNVTVSEEVIHRIEAAPDFSLLDVEEAIKEPYLGQADTEARRQLKKRARHIVPWPGHGEKATLDDILKGRRINLHLRFSYDWVDTEYTAALTAFQTLFEIVHGCYQASKFQLPSTSLGQMVDSFRTGSGFVQARGYEYDTPIYERLQIFKNGNAVLTFKKETDAEEAAKLLLEVEQQ